MATIKQENQAITNNKVGTKTYGRVVLTLKNCLLPEDKRSPTPSHVDGLDSLTEYDLRILGCELIQTAGILLKLPQVAMATGQVLFQRFYYSKSYVRHPMETTAMGCICLASKIEEAPRRIRDVINVIHHIKQVKGGKTIQPMILDQNYIALKNQVIKAERRVLKELGFCVHVKHPHKIIVMYLQVLGFERHQMFMQMSWNYMNDSLRTDVFVRYQPEAVACACIYLSARQLKLALPRKPAWFSIFGVEEDDIMDVCHRILRLYKRPKPNADELERRVEELRQSYQEARLRARGIGLSANNTPMGGFNSPGSRQSSPLRGQDVAGRKDKRGGSGTSDSPSKNNHAHEKDRDRGKDSRSQSRSRSRSHTPPPKHRKRSKKIRYISRSRSRDRKHKSHKSNRPISRSPSLTPPLRNNRKMQREKRYRSRSRSHELSRKDRSRSRELSRKDRSRSRSHEKYDRYDKYHDKYYDKPKSKSKHRGDDDHIKVRSGKDSRR